MPNLYKNSSVNRRKTWFLMTGFFIFTISVAYLIAYAFDSPVILYLGFFLSLLMNLYSYWQSDKIVLKMAGAKKADENEYRELHRLVENLSISAGLPKPAIYIVEDNSPNAFATGRSPKHAAVAVTTGILGRLEKVELEGVIAHELAHIANYDILISSIATILLGTIVIIADIGLRSGLRGQSSDNKRVGPIFLILSLLAYLLAPLVANLMQLAISRKREFLADASGALITRYPEGLARALEKLEASPLDLRRANKASAHMYIVAPLKSLGQKKRVSAVNKLFMTHPPTYERVAKLRAMN